MSDTEEEIDYDILVQEDDEDDPFAHKAGDASDSSGHESSVVEPQAFPADPSEASAADNTPVPKEGVGVQAVSETEAVATGGVTVAKEEDEEGKDEEIVIEGSCRSATGGLAEADPDIQRLLEDGAKLVVELEHTGLADMLIDTLLEGDSTLAQALKHSAR